VCSCERDRDRQQCVRRASVLFVGEIECVLLLQNVFSYYRMCSLTIECVLLLSVLFVGERGSPEGEREREEREFVCVVEREREEGRERER